MQERYLKKDNETQLEYELRLVDILKTERPEDLEWEDIKQFIGFEGNKDSLRKANDTPYGGYKVYKYYSKKIEDLIKNSTNEKLIEEKMKEINKQQQELEKMKIMFQDQKREYRALLRTDARFSHLLDEMKKSIEVLNESKPFMRDYNTLDELCEKEIEATLILSDWHYGIEEKNYWNEINISILHKRVQELKNKTIKYCKRHGVNVLHVEILGDMINGLIHLGTRVSNEEDSIHQAMHVSELLGEMLNDLSKHIPQIKVYSATGNHGRCSANIKESIDTENFEKIIPWYLETRLRDNKNIEIITNKYEEDIIIYNFLNETIFAVHGHNDKISDAVSNLSEMFKIYPTEVHMGHYHSYQEFDKHSIVTIVNGTLSGVDKYAKNIRKTSIPTQVLSIYNKQGKECTYKIKI
ncbi:MAG: hypothetical protein ACLTDM_04330 [Clostridium butyricum]